MFDTVNLQRQVNTIDILISVLSDELVQQPQTCTPDGPHTSLVREMEEALRELRQARGVRKMLLTAIESRGDGAPKRAHSAKPLRRSSRPFAA